VLRALALIGPLFALPSCTTTVTLGIDDPRAYPDGATIIHCGPIDCTPGSICCDATCGICASEHTGCPAELPACGPPDAAVVPYACSNTEPCASGFFCDRRNCADERGICTRIPASCDHANPVATCGCDGVAYRSSCDAQHVEQSTTLPTCGPCNPPAITITSGCTTSLGWAWNGSACTEQIGCVCSGHCEALESSQMDCNARYQAQCGRFFPCDETSCRRGTEYCLTSMGEGACVAAPTGCSVLDCACVRSGLPTTSCTDEGNGVIRATL
jgi:hypothetical protein